LSNNSEIGQRYAIALYELAEETKNTPSIEKDLIALKALLDKNKELNRTINSPTIKRNTYVSLFSKILIKMKANELTIKFINTIALNGRISLLDEIINSFLEKLENVRGNLYAEVLSTITLKDDTLKAVRLMIRQITKEKNDKKISLNTKIDPSILGGLIVRVGSTMIDSSIKTQLSRLKIIMKGA